jgi:tape measure domain-containing protein
MQSGGQAAGIQLQVGLDLAFFRNQLPKLGAAAAGYTLPINIKFDRRAVQNELNALGRNISQRTYRLEVATNLAAEIELAKKLTTALDKLGRSQQTAKTGVGQRLGVGAIGRAPKDKGLGYKDVQKLYKASADAGLLAFDKEIARTKVSMVAAMDAIGVDAIAGLLNGLSSQDARLRAAAESIGENLIKTTKTSLGIASPSKKFEEIGKNVGKGFEKGALSSMDNAFDAMENKMRQRGKILDTIARGIFGMLGMDPAAMMQQARQQKAVPPRTPIAGLLPSYTSRGAKEEIMRQLGAGGGGGGPSVAQGPGRLALTDEMLQRRINDFEVRVAKVREIFDPREFEFATLRLFRAVGNALEQAADQAEQAAKQAKSARIDSSVDGLMRSIDNAIKVAQARVRVGRGLLTGEAQVSDLGRTVQPALPPTRIAGLLPPAVGRAPNVYSTSGESQTELFARREREARMRSALREMDVMGGGAGRPSSPYSYVNRAARPTSAMVPYAAGGALVPTMGGGGIGGNVPPRPPSGGGGMGGAGSFGRALGGINLPGTGVVREIGSEFAMAAKQVLLFGTAYKALAFLTSFPAQVGQAIGALQSFNNTLKAISPTANEAKASNQFILDIVDRYNVPLQSARDGFTKLYASMAPAGFKGDEIRALFTGVSQAAATFGMSADKVDRVNYAFAQMASKGQVMSEELKGQLGDVLPGAMGIFAEAAGFKGPDAIQKFSKALEDGAYKGEAMRGLLKNVTVVLTKEFGPGAEGAARTFQGVINRMQNSTRLLYEAFEPVAVGFLNSVVVPLTSGIKTITDGFNAFFTSTQAKTAGGMAFAQELERLKPAFEGIRANVAALMPVLQTLGGVLLEVGKVFLQIAGNPFVGYLARVYLSVLPLVAIIKVLNLQALIPMIGSLLRAIPAFVTFNSLMLQGNRAGLALKTTTFLLGTTSSVTAGKIRLVGTALLSLGMPAVLLGIGALIERFMMLKGAVDGVRQSTQQMVGSISSLANTGAVREIKNIGADTQKQIATFKGLKPFVSGGLGNAPQRRLTEDAAKKMEELGLGAFVSKGVTGPFVNDFLNASKIIEERLKGLGKTADSVKEKMPLAEKAAAALAKQAKQGIEPIAEGAGAGAGKPPKEKSLETYYGLQDTLAKNAADFAAAQTEEEFRHKIELLEMYYDIQETRANAYQRDALRFEREMVMIEARRQEARLKAQLDVQRAQSSVAGGAGGGGGAGSGGKGLGAGIAQYITGDPSSPFYRADHGGGNYHEHLAFVSRQAAEEAYKKLTSAGIQVTEFKGKSRVGRHTPGSAHYEGLAFDVPGAQVPVGRERELTARVQSTLGIGGARPAPVPASQKRDAVAEQKTLQASIAKTATERMADAKAAQEQIVALEKYRATAFPNIEQETQNKLLTKRNELFRSGMTDEQIDKEIKLYENQERGTAALAAVQRLYDGNIIKLDKYNELMAIFNQDIATQNTLLQQNATLMAQAKFDQAIKGIQDQLAMARSFTPDQEMRTQIAQEGFVGEQAESIFQERKTLQGAQKLKEDMQGIASSIGDSFGTAFKGIITGSMTAQEALAGMFQSIADHFADMVAKMIAEWLKAQLIKGFMSILGMLIPGGGGGIGAGLSSGFDAGPSSAIDTSAAGWGTAFNTPLKFANGGIAAGGFTAFANGGMVTGPTMGLVGEGRYNEAIVPLPDGKSIPVELAGGGSSSPTVIVNVDAKGSQVEGNEQNANQLGRVISAAVQTELIKQQRPGGLLAR